MDNISSIIRSGMKGGDTIEPEPEKGARTDGVCTYFGYHCCNGNCRIGSYWPPGRKNVQQCDYFAVSETIKNR
jgi:hypothetical protein